MKKSILNAIGLAAMFLLLFSCNKSQEISSKSIESDIEFSPILRLPTRTNDITTASLSEFYVNSFLEGASNTVPTNYWNTKCTKSGNIWSLEQKHYWTSDDKKQYFYAFYPATTTENSWDASVKKVKDYAPKSVLSEQYDLLYAFNYGNKTEFTKKCVALNFKHLLSNIDFKVRNSNPALTFKIKGIKIKYVKRDGIFTPNNNKTSEAIFGTWTAGSENTNYEYKYQTDKSLDKNSSFETLLDGQNTFKLVPQTLTPWEQKTNKTNTNMGAYVALKMQVLQNGKQVYPKNEGKYGWAAIPLTVKGATGVSVAENQWVMGKKYVYKLDLKNGGFQEPNPNKPEDDDEIDPDPGVDPGNPILQDSEICFEPTVAAWEEVVELIIEM